MEKVKKTKTNENHQGLILMYAQQLAIGLDPAQLRNELSPEERYEAVRLCRKYWCPACG